MSEGGLIPQYGGQMCPACGIPEITLEMMGIAGVKSNEKFECPVCGCTLKYTTVKQFPYEQIHLHIVSDVLTAGGRIK